MPGIASGLALLMVLAANAATRQHSIGTLARRTRVGRPRTPIVALAAANAFSGMGQTAVVAFFISYLTSVRIAPGTAGYVLAGASAAGTLTRLIMGVLIDRRRGTGLLTASTMFLVGALGLGTLSLVSSSIASVMIVSVIAFAAATGWPGLTNLAVMRIWPHAAAAANGVTFMASSTGCVIGPALIGYLVATTGFGFAWSVVAGIFTLGGLSLAATHVVVRQSPTLAAYL